MEKKSICYAGAGHPPMLLKSRSAGATREVAENGLFLGAFPIAKYESVEVPFEEGDWCVLYTDGIPEMTDPCLQEFGADRFKLFLEDNQDLSADPFVDRLLDELSRWADRASGREPEDDLTVVAFRSKSAQ
jgi:serine phosphatase RsbU (regulator of sigma subunit)